MTRIAITRIATHASFLRRSQPRIFLSASRIDVLFITPQKGMRRFIADFLSGILRGWNQE